MMHYTPLQASEALQLDWVRKAVQFTTEMYVFRSAMNPVQIDETALEGLVGPPKA